MVVRKARRGTVTPFFLVGLCALLIGSICAAVIHVDRVASEIWDSASSQITVLKLELEATRTELKYLRDLYGPVSDVLTSEDVTLIKKIDSAINEGREESHIRTATAAVLASKLHGVPIDTVLGVMYVESRFDPRAVSNADAKGLMQLTNLIWNHYSQSFPDDKDVYDEIMNACAGTHFLSDLRKQYGADEPALLHYWGGPAAVEEGGSYAGLVLAAAQKWRDALWNS